MTLDRTGRRVLGSLMEKEMTTPELYPLSLNALLHACNQKSSREPVLQLSEDEVRAGLDALEALELVSVSREGRVARFEHRIRTVLQLRRDETAILCLLLLREAQTAGELRARSDRMFPFDDPAQVLAALERLASRPDPLAQALPRSPGSREVRWIDLLGESGAEQEMEHRAVKPNDDQNAHILQRLAALERRVDELEAAQRSRSE